MGLDISDSVFIEPSVGPKLSQENGDDLGLNPVRLDPEFRQGLAEIGNGLFRDRIVDRCPQPTHTSVPFEADHVLLGTVGEECFLARF